MRRQPDELVAMQYGPCALDTSVNGLPVRITEATEYPFSDEFTFTVDPEQTTAFALTFRKPGHVEKIEIADLPDASISRAHDYVSIRKKWAKGDVVRVRFQCSVRMAPQPNSETVQGKAGGLYLQRGPLVYALPFPYQWKVIREIGETGFKNYAVVTKDTSGWDYAIDPNAVFTLKRDMKTDRLHPWMESPLQLHGPLLTRAGERVTVSLVPEGCTVLRRVTFPVAQ